MLSEMTPLKINGQLRPLLDVADWAVVGAVGAEIPPRKVVLHQRHQVETEHCEKCVDDGGGAHNEYAAVLAAHSVREDGGVAAEAVSTGRRRRGHLLEKVRELDIYYCTQFHE